MIDFSTISTGTIAATLMLYIAVAVVVMLIVMDRKHPLPARRSRSHEVSDLLGAAFALFVAVVGMAMLLEGAASR